MTVSRHRLVVSALAMVVFVGAISLIALRSRTGGCAVPPPVPSLNAQLKAIGGFDLPLVSADELDEGARRAAAATGVDLSDINPAHAVSVTAVAPARRDALVVPLTRRAGQSSSGQVVGLVAFFKACSGQAYFGGVDDLARHGPPGSVVQAFPAVDRSTAAGRLGGTASPDLVFTASPFKPAWRDPSSGRTTPAQY